MFILAWLPVGIVVKRLDDDRHSYNMPAESPVYVVETPDGYVLVDPRTEQSGLLDPMQVQTLVIPRPFGLLIDYGNPRYCDPNFVHVTIGDGTFVRGETKDGLTVSIHGDLFFTCSRDALLVYQKTNEGVERSELKLKTVAFDSGTRWFQTNLTDPFDPTDCEIGTESRRK